MKQILLLIWVVLLGAHAFAQIDSNDSLAVTNPKFKKAITDVCPLCMTDGRLNVEVCRTVKNLFIGDSSELSSSREFWEYIELEEDDIYFYNRDVAQLRYFTQLEALYIDLTYNKGRVDSLYTFPTSLKSLHIASDNPLQYLPPLPSGLKNFEIECTNCALALVALPTDLTHLHWSSGDSLPILPPHLRYLSVKNDTTWLHKELPTTLDTLIFKLYTPNSMPRKLPNRLRVLDCGGKISTFPPDYLPSSLKELYCRATQMVALPARLPDSLHVLDCSFNALVELPTLPASLRVLSCSNNMLETLPTLPNTLQTLNCNDNMLIALPKRLPTSLRVLTCNKNMLLALPKKLPHSLQLLDCSKNQLKRLPYLSPVLTKLNCSDNLLSQLPILPATLIELDCDYNAISCLPNRPKSLLKLNTP